MMKRVFVLAGVSAIALGLSACGGAGDYCKDFKSTDRTVQAVKDGIEKGVASGKIKADEIAKKIADATPAGAAVPGGDIKKACEFYVGIAKEYNIDLPKPE